MGRFVSATGQFLLATYRQFSRPPTGSFSCPLTGEWFGLRSDRRDSLNWPAARTAVQVGYQPL
jgi:hypothetical protein